ncbi:siderophore-interacting protein [Celeribacter litoreus]|uniref:siderophore-interacting protein n=1 Tax=Celeribacter litoreus TaxID=2876714 RepID=UPI001CCCAB97|nr:siderophore-interacting protein [Celeribacter litoreus]MCA0042332.1 siderophore-interacting protein [Celeribacter litoreus]
MTAPVIRRVRHELKRRDLTVRQTERLTPNMLRITLEGPELADFASGSFDDHLKVFIPQKEGDPQMRDYTPRRFDNDAQQLVIDFADHGEGPAASWARNAKEGDALKIGGPRGSRIIEGDIAHWVLIGDESALPAIGRKVEELPAGVTATVIAAVPSADDIQTFDTSADVSVTWVYRPFDQATDAAPFVDAIETLDLPENTFVWIATEAGVAKTLREKMLERGHPLTWLKAAGYWVSGQAESSIKDLDA